MMAMGKSVDSWASSPAVRRGMQANRSRDTAPELALRRAAFALGLRYYVDRRPVPQLRTRADMSFPRARVAVFMDGCFWHGCPLHYVPPRANSGFWEAKIAENRDRDRRNDSALVAAGWVSLRFWEHEAVETAAERIAMVVRARLPGG